jgi:hypothetical protein
MLIASSKETKVAGAYSGEPSCAMWPAAAAVGGSVTVAMVDRFR